MRFTLDVLRDLSRFRRRPEGAIAVELAFVVPVLAIAVVGSVDYALAFQEKLKLESAARAGVQYAMYKGYQNTDTTEIEQRARDDYGDDALSVTASYVCSCLDGTVVSCSTGYCSGGEVPLKTLTVTATRDHSLLLDWPGFANPLSLTGDATARIR